MELAIESLRVETVFGEVLSAMRHWQIKSRRKCL